MQFPRISGNWVNAALACLLTLSSACRQPAEDSSITTVLSNATVIDGTGAAPKPHATVALSGSRIAYVGPANEAPRAPQAKQVDLSGRWVLPGFIDMHAHLDSGPYAPLFLAQLVAFGTTTARAPSNPNIALRDRVASGELVGPELFLAGMLINGPDARFGQRGQTEADYRAIVAADAARGVEFVKLYSGVPPGLALAVIDEAHRRGLRVIGHLGTTTWQEAADGGIDSLTHAWYSGLVHSVVPDANREELRGFFIPPGPGGFDAGLFRRWREVADPEGPEVVALADLLIQHDIDVDPTLVLGEAITWGDDPKALERLEPDKALAGQAESWRSGPHPYSASWTPEQFAEAKRAWPLMMDIIRLFHEKGVLLTAGTDYLNPWMTPGVAYHRELELLVSAGISPLDVLSIATRNGARALQILEETGTVEPGKRADLVILTADPVENISNTRRIEQVYLRGVPHEPSVLLEKARSQVEAR